MLGPRRVICSSMRFQEQTHCTRERVKEDERESGGGGPDEDPMQRDKGEREEREMQVYRVQQARREREIQV